jgi:hypothetical protein
MFIYLLCFVKIIFCKAFWLIQRNNTSLNTNKFRTIVLNDPPFGF